jgi:hypothetical protein
MAAWRPRDGTDTSATPICEERREEGCKSGQDAAEAYMEEQENRARKIALVVVPSSSAAPWT